MLLLDFPGIWFFRQKTASKNMQNFTPDTDNEKKEGILTITYAKEPTYSGTWLYVPRIGPDAPVAFCTRILNHVVVPGAFSIVPSICSTRP